MIGRRFKQYAEGSASCRSLLGLRRNCWWPVVHLEADAVAAADGDQHTYRSRQLTK
jgi:hypothetical protein